jgi:diacylglycerol O-acyltransferase / wax synthase
MRERMNDTEALMWAVEQHPHLASTMGSVFLLDGPPPIDRLRAALTSAVAAVPRLRQRVVEPSTSLTGPEWTSDTAFDLDHHLRHVRVASPGTPEQVRLLAAQFLADPFDRSRPLWQVLVVTGLRGGRAALVAKLHHSITDGAGALLVAGHLVETEADTPMPEPIDLDEVFEGDRLADLAPPPDRPPVGDQLRRGAEWALRFVNDAAASLGDTASLPNLGSSALASARSLLTQLPGTERHTSPLWAARSRNRRMEWISLPLPPALERARELGGTLNDLFVTATTEGAVRYHEHFDVEPPELTATIIVSTRGGAAGELSNAFTPTAAVLPAGRDLAPEHRFAAVAEVLATQKAAARERDLTPLAGLANLLPAGLAVGVALDQAGRVDFATSNLRGFPMPLWVAGRRITALYPIGPVGGTAFNITLMSNLDELHVGLNIDPVAVVDPPRLARDITEGFAALGVGGRRSR